MRVPKRGTTPYKELCGHTVSIVIADVIVFRIFFIYFPITSEPWRFPGLIYSVYLLKKRYTIGCKLFFRMHMVISPNTPFPKNNCLLCKLSDSIFPNNFSFTLWKTSTLCRKKPFTFFRIFKHIQSPNVVENYTQSIIQLYGALGTSLHDKVCVSTATTRFWNHFSAALSTIVRL